MQSSFWKCCFDLGDPPTDMITKEFEEWIATDNDVQMSWITTIKEFCKIVTVTNSVKLDDQRIENFL